MQVNFKFNVSKADCEQAVSPLANQFAAVAGLRWKKIELMNEAEGEISDNGGVIMNEQPYQGEDMNDVTVKPKKRGKTGWIITATAIGLLLIVGYSLRSQFVSAIGAPAPDFTLSLLDGGELSLAEQRGLVVVVNFWASWCPPCRDEAPALERVWREYEDKGVVFVGVNVNDVTDNAMAFIEEFNITYPNGPDPYNRISKAYHVTGVPETFLIARDGRLAKWYRGPVTEAGLRAALEELLQP